LITVESHLTASLVGSDCNITNANSFVKRMFTAAAILSHNQYSLSLAPLIYDAGTSD
jgi:hypothetical protein